MLRSAFASFLVPCVKSKKRCHLRPLPATSVAPSNCPDTLLCAACLPPACSPACLQGVRLYWLALGGLIQAERSRTGSSPCGPARLLSTPLFYRCVAACSFEVVIAAYRMVGVRGCA